MDKGTWLKDGGIKSRKLWFAIFIALMIFVGALLTLKYPGFGANYETLVGGLLGISGVYLAGNVTSRWASSKNVKFSAKKEDEELPKGDDKEDLSG